MHIRATNLLSPLVISQVENICLFFSPSVLDNSKNDLDKFPKIPRSVLLLFYFIYSVLTRTERKE